jgi:hypothetical protein
MQLALDEPIAGRGVFAHGLTERLCQPIAFGTHLGHVAQLAREMGVPLQHVGERFLIALQCVTQMDALTGIGVLLASESPSGLGQLCEPLCVSLPLAHQGDRQSVEVLDALKRPERQRPKLRLQLLDALAQLTQLGPCRGRRLRRLCQRGAALLWGLAREPPGAGELGVVRPTRAR